MWAKNKQLFRYTALHSVVKRYTSYITYLDLGVQDRGPPQGPRGGGPALWGVGRVGVNILGPRGASGRDPEGSWKGRAGLSSLHQTETFFFLFFKLQTTK
jgi:hypothetical protein